MLNRLKSKGLNRKEQSLLFEALEQFANLGDTAADFEAFRQKWPTFIPDTALSSAKARDNYLSNPQTLTALLNTVRSLVRGLWQGGVVASRSLAVLLGFGKFRLDVRSITDTSLALELTVMDFSGVFWPRARILPNWEGGDLQCIPQSDLQQAVWQLFRSSWRARTCRACGRYFIAEKANASHCSVKCSHETRRRQKLNWWRENLRPQTSRRGES